MITSTDFELLNQFTARVSADPVKTDLELRCNHCGLCACDVEDGDELGLLAASAVAHGHECPSMPRGLL